jgi:hypothetical protein
MRYLTAAVNHERRLNDDFADKIAAALGDW